MHYLQFVILKQLESERRVCAESIHTPISDHVLCGKINDYFIYINKKYAITTTV